MPNLEEVIREHAYHLWIADGQPEGQADVYWLSAQREILTTSLKAQAKPQLPRTWIRYPPRSSLSKRRGSPDREKANLALHSSSRASRLRRRVRAGMRY